MIPFMFVSSTGSFFSLIDFLTVELARTVSFQFYNHLQYEGQCTVLPFLSSFGLWLIVRS